MASVSRVSKALEAGKVFSCKAGEIKPVSFSCMSMVIWTELVSRSA